MGILNFSKFFKSEVHKAKHKETNEAVALKRILMHNEKEGVFIRASGSISLFVILKIAVKEKLIENK